MAGAAPGDVPLALGTIFGLPWALGRTHQRDSFSFENSDYLLEAKWQRGPIEPVDLRGFDGVIKARDAAREASSIQSTEARSTSRGTPYLIS